MDFNYLQERVKIHRQSLHQIPEISFDLVKTHAYVRSTLESMGYEVETVAQTGLIAAKKGRQTQSIAFRADMDALRVLEKTNAPFASLTPGHMHACGHDGHMAVLLGFAEYVSKLEQTEKTIVFIFQPAEEGPGGAKVIIDEGIFEKYNIESIFGFHVYPELEEGKIGLVRGPMMAQNGEFDLTILGKSSHGAQPQSGNDAIVAAGSLITQYQSIISRFLDPLVPSVVTIGTIQGGEARNIIAQTVLMSGTIRTFETPVYERIKQAIYDINKAVEIAYGVRVEIDLRDYYPPVINDDQLFDAVKDILDEEEVALIRPMMFAEDFAFYQQKVPGLFMMLGTRNESLGYVHPLHSCYFNLEESTLLKGVKTYIKICAQLNYF
ncbi:MAG: M20 metallopeptidase family protein [Candidatus Izemoplasmataceae bacterium]|jgi:amidohydrolase|uniref:M20 metallopeptidase family protein n=1 Tax=Liberiplasma polymorphum TaxID=3374570 RepID=UPI0037711F5C